MTCLSPFSTSLLVICYLLWDDLSSIPLEHFLSGYLILTLMWLVYPPWAPPKWSSVTYFEKTCLSPLSTSLVVICYLHWGDLSTPLEPPYWSSVSYFEMTCLSPLSTSLMVSCYLLWDDLSIPLEHLLNGHLFLTLRRLVYLPWAPP